MSPGRPARFVCRFLVPKVEQGFSFEADSAENAAQQAGFAHDALALVYRNVTPDGLVEQIRFALIQTRDEKGAEAGPFVVRSYFRCCSKRGRPAGNLRLDQIATQLGWLGPFEELLEPWDDEETWEAAELRTSVERAARMAAGQAEARVRAKRGTGGVRATAGLDLDPAPTEAGGA